MDRQALQLRPPGGQVRLLAGLALGTDGGDQFDDHLAAVADDGHLGVPVLGDLGRVDVRVHHRGLGGEAVQAAGHPVVEPGPERHQQVRLLQRADRRDRCRACRACRGSAGGCWGTRPGPSAWSPRASRSARPACKQILARARLDHAAADVEHRALRRHHHPGRLAHLAGVRPGHRVVAGQVERDRPAELRSWPAARPSRCPPAPGRAGRWRPREMPPPRSWRCRRPR